MPGARSIRIKKYPLAIPRPKRDLGPAGHGNQPPWASSGGGDEPDFTLAERRGVEGDFTAVGRPRGMERQERLSRELTQPSTVRVSRPEVPMARTVGNERDRLPV